MRSRFSAVLFSMMMLVTAVGCSATSRPHLDVDLGSEAPVYTLNSGDKLRVTVFNEPSLTGEFSVGSDGTIAFPLIGGVPVRDKTIAQAQDAIRKRLADGYVTDPRVSIEVLNYRPYYILGEIAHPSQYPYSVGLTVTQAIAVAGGFTYRANERHVFIRHANETREHKVDIRKNVIDVKPGDTIRVGERYF